MRNRNTFEFAAAIRIDALPSPLDIESTTSPRAALGSKFAQVGAYLFALALVIPSELARLNELASLRVPPAEWLMNLNVDTSLFVGLLLLAPLPWLLHEGIRWHRRDMLAAWGDWLARLCTPAASPTARTDWRSWGLAIFVGLLSLFESARVGREFGNLPPAYHDEYSYLLQAKTFLAGRFCFESPPSRQLFDQMHVLNAGHFASRYFPGTGLWLAPFVAIGHPYLGEWLAGALSAMLIFWTGRELGGAGVGFLAGVLTALSPGMALFSNLLLSHQPTLVGLSLFLFAFFRWRNTRHWSHALWAGVGLSFAMLCRPLTAAGVALPFGVSSLFWALRGDGISRRQPLTVRIASLLALGAPLLLGLAGLFFYNLALTGSGWLTPYQLYTDLYTPRHVFGFNNVQQGEQALAGRDLPPVTRNYDIWAENLTPALALRNVMHRLVASWQWTLGIIPLGMALIAWSGLKSPNGGGWGLVIAAIVSLHLAHVPYWFDGIMHWHYVFESGPLWALVFAGATGSLLQAWESEHRPWMPLWWGALIVVACLTTHFSLQPFWAARLEAGIREVRFSRNRYAAFNQLIRERVTVRPAVVLIEPDPSDRHIDYVVNDPPLDGPLLYARYLPAETPLPDILALFSDRHVYLYRALDGSLTYLRGPTPPAKNVSGKP